MQDLPVVDNSTSRSAFDQAMLMRVMRTTGGLPRINQVTVYNYNNIMLVIVNELNSVMTVMDRIIYDVIHHHATIPLPLNCTLVDGSAHAVVVRIDTAAAGAGCTDQRDGYQHGWTGA